MVRTAGTPARLELTPDRTTIKADGDDMSFVTVKMLDKDGNECPNADDELLFSVEGAKYQAACNGDATSLEPFEKPQMRLFHGALVAIVRADKKAGKAVLTVTDKDNPEITAKAVITVEKAR